MVSSPSPAAVQNLNEDKRRKQNIERAKANHLSRQLQVRLQYARLKVDHGWQKQNLNEVENLYFHHSHLRGPRPYPTTLLPATTQRDPVNPPTSTQSSLSFKLGGSSNLSRTASTAPPNDASDEALLEEDDPSATTLESTADLASAPNAQSAKATQNPLPAGPSPTLDPTLLPVELTSSSLISMDVDQDEKSPSTVHPSASYPSPRVPSATTATPAYHTWSTTTPGSSGHAMTSSTPVATPTFSSTSQKQSLPPQSKPRSKPKTKSQSHSNLATSSTSTSNLATSDPYGFNASSSLTYDSFWASTSSRTYGGSPSGIQPTLGAGFVYNGDDGKVRTPAVPVGRVVAGREG